MGDFNNVNRVYLLIGVASVLLLLGVVVMSLSGGGDEYDVNNQQQVQQAVNNPVQNNPASLNLAALPAYSECAWEETNEFTDICDGDFKVQKRKFVCGPLGCQNGDCVQGQEEMRNTSKLPVECFNCRQNGDIAICENDIPPPTGLSVSRETEDSITITWNADESVDSYDVYYCVNGINCDVDEIENWSKVNIYGKTLENTQATEASVGGLSPGKRYKFKIRAVRSDSFLNTTDWSIITGTTKINPLQRASTYKDNSSVEYNPRVINTGG